MSHDHNCPDQPARPNSAMRIRNIPLPGSVPVSARIPSRYLKMGPLRSVSGALHLLAYLYILRRGIGPVRYRTPIGATYPRPPRLCCVARRNLACGA